MTRLKPRPKPRDATAKTTLRGRASCPSATRRVGELRGGRASCPSATRVSGGGSVGGRASCPSATRLVGEPRGGRASCPSATRLSVSPAGTGILPVSNRSPPRVRRNHRSQTRKTGIERSADGSAGNLCVAIYKTNRRMPSTSHKSKQSRHAFGRSRTRRPALEHWPNPFGRADGQVMRELRRRELEQSQKDGFRGPNRRARRGPPAARTRKASASRRQLSYRVIIRSWRRFRLPDFSRVLADVHREFEQEIEKPENKTRSLT